MRIRIDVAYDGGQFHGWAAQPRLRTVQGVLEAALATVLRVSEVRVVCAGRTDTGVHARGQVTHVDVEPAVLAQAAGRSPQAPVEALVGRLNGVLPADLRVRRAAEVPAEFDARFSALWRRYAYRIADAPEYVDPLARGHVTRWPRRLDLGAMNAAAIDLVGLHDYASFCKAREGATTIRTVHELHWDRDPTGVAVGTVIADAFCHSMVRALVGCLVAIGEGRRDVSWARAVLEQGARGSGVAVAPATGLTLEEVGYPPDSELGARLLVTRAKRTSTEPESHDE